MSLMLRKNCQEILDKTNLSEYHARISENNKNLTIVGPCGRSLFTISGIKFDRITPTTKEIEFAVELLEEFCLKHKVQIQIVLETKAKLYEAKEPPIKKNYAVNTGQNYVKFYDNDANLILALNVITGIFDLDTQYNKNNTHIVTSKTFQRFASATLERSMRKEFDVHAKYDAIQKAYDSAVAALQTCNI